MTKIVSLHILFLSLLTQLYGGAVLSDRPDSAYIFAYSPSEESGREGLLIAWSKDKNDWTVLRHKFLYSDFGPWGSGKRMISPFLFKDNNGWWHCLWTLNDRRGGFAHASSKDLVFWYRQSYPLVIENNNCLDIEVSADHDDDAYIISFKSRAGEDSLYHFIKTNDFKNYSAAELLPAEKCLESRQKVLLAERLENGIIHKVPYEIVAQLIKAEQQEIKKQQLNNETAEGDSARFTGLSQVVARVSIDAGQSKKISDLLFGIFFEDINYAADGGIYAELIQNRGFEYNGRGRGDSSWNSKTAWSVNGEHTEFSIDSAWPLHPNNKHYAVLNIEQSGAAFINTGFDSIAVKEDDSYIFSLFARNPDKKDKKLSLRLVGKNNTIYGQSEIVVSSTMWDKYEVDIVSRATAGDARLEIVVQESGTINLDMISLFPQRTFKNRRNGLRPDLVKAIIDLKPQFVRFPGGCVAHGRGLENIYHWKNTVGPLEARDPQFNIWGYHQSYGLGYYEYFQFCEDIGAEPLPVVAAAVPCQNSPGGQQGGLPMAEMDTYVEDVLDLIEWANGDTNTKWGRKRAAAGHPQPFNLKYLGIGNEDLITDVFEERFRMIYQAVAKKHPEITIIGTVGPFSEGTDYEEGWALANELNLPMVDEHYYRNPGWFIYNQDFYDSYDRSKSKVYLGEYASWGNTWFNALAEALYLTAIERNGDVVSMASYAPLLAREGHTQWKTDLIFFNNTEVKPTVNYDVHKLFGQNTGDEYIESRIKIEEKRHGVAERVAVSSVRDSKSGDIIVKFVNLLPVPVNTYLDLKELPFKKYSLAESVLSGKPNDKKVPLQSKAMSLSTDGKYKLPAYSMSVIRVSGRD